MSLRARPTRYTPPGMALPFLPSACATWLIHGASCAALGTATKATARSNAARNAVIAAMGCLSAKRGHVGPAPACAGSAGHTFGQNHLRRSTWIGERLRSRAPGLAQPPPPCPAGQHPESRRQRAGGDRATVQVELHLQAAGLGAGIEAAVRAV